MEEREVVWYFLRAMPSKFDALTLSLEQYGDLDKVSLDEVIGSLMVHELWLKEHESCEEEQALLVKAMSKAMSKAMLTNEEEFPFHKRGRHRGHGRGQGRGRGWGCNQPPYEEKKPLDKLAIQCYNR